MTDQRAYSTDDPKAVEAYRKAVADQQPYGERLKADLEALGVGTNVMFRGAFALGERRYIAGLERKGDHVPDGWRFSKTAGLLVPRGGKPGKPARDWVDAHLPPDPHHALAPFGLAPAAWIAGSGFSYRMVRPEVFELDGTLWARYEAEPGSTERESGFDSRPCTWTERKLSEFYLASDELAARTETAATS